MSLFIWNCKYVDKRNYAPRHFLDIKKIFNIDIIYTCNPRMQLATVKLLKYTDKNAG